MEKSSLIGELLAKRAKEKNINESILIEENINTTDSKNLRRDVRKNGLKF